MPLCIVYITRLLTSSRMWLSETARKSSSVTMSSTASVRIWSCASQQLRNTAMFSWATLLFGRLDRILAAWITCTFNMKYFQFKVKYFFHFKTLQMLFHPSHLRTEVLYLLGCTFDHLDSYKDRKIEHQTNKTPYLVAAREQKLNPQNSIQ